jgi:hypothetical protein
LGSDSGNLGYGISTKFQPGQNADNYEIAQAATAAETLTFQAYPNPATASSTFDVDVRLANDENVTVGLYTPEGNLVRSIYRGMITRNTNRNFRASLSGILPGTYYLRLIGRARTRSRRIVIN